MKKTPMILKIIGRIFIFFYELFKYPKLFFTRRFLWKKYRKGILFNSVSSYELENEEKLTRHYLTTWYLKPNLEKLENDIESIMQVKKIKYNAIKLSQIENSDYDSIVKSLKSGSKKTWEPIIQIIEELTFHFPKIKEFVVRMTEDSSGFVRETALLILEDGKFDFQERKNIYEMLYQDRNKKVRDRVLDMIFREGKKKKNEFVDFLEQWKKEEQDQSIKDSLEWMYK
ncbi:hypothetical protein [Flavivirga spongiicola]|uniref:HEAT repeat domain-containing protein n=1 Tax=Flavivirga spongiicola TaxID=421621 RepID=A0ABU7XQG8_9FLAO|nr:hypothetical protein [Flavivirga sp. MEBiC05379]MDO5981756.1 hypothetical protein [Flavivirga sp. MEBiC05379]